MDAQAHEGGVARPTCTRAAIDRLPRWCVATRRIAALATAGALAIALAAAPAQAIITVPIPADPPAAPPPIASLPAAGEAAPPAAAIGDPIEPDAVCGDWSRQSSYGGAWPASSTWWEYRCAYQYPQCTGMCNADWAPYVWTDYFYWDGSKSVFYGEFYGDWYYDSMWSASGCSYWWDAPSSQWYRFEEPGCGLPEPPANATPTARYTFDCAGSTCSFDAGASTDSDGTIADYSWVFGDGTGASGATATHTYAEPGSYTATLTVTDDQGGWARDSKLVSIEPPPPPNAAPTASFGLSCAGLSCTLDGGASADSDGTIVQYRWEFGDGATGSGRTVPHSYTQAGSYTVKLTVTDDDGASGTASSTVAPVTGLTARGYKQKGVQKVELSWIGSSGVSYDVLRDGTRIATVAGASYTDSLDRRSSGTYRYQVCAAGSQICSSQATVNF
jgi:PKD repeat protein